MLLGCYGVAAGSNKGLELTASSVRSCLAPASGSSSGLALYAYAVELTWLELREGVEDRRYQRVEVHHTVRWRTDKKNAEGHRCQVLLELDAPVHRDQRIVLAHHTPQKLAVRNARPATADHGIDTVPLERCGEVYRQLLVKKNAHQPAG
jgi:hypothetical protein